MVYLVVETIEEDIMAYDIGQGISDALGSIGEGLVTRKERREEREKLIGQHEAIEEDLYAEYQSLLNKGSGENVVKAAQTEYEKWSKRGDELSDESTKKIEGIISEYDKGEVRKSRRLQNRAAELQIELSEATNPIIAKTKAAQLKAVLNTNQATEDKRNRVKALGEFRSVYGKETSKGIPDTEDVWVEGERDKTPTLDHYKSDAYWEEADPDAFENWRTRHLQDFAPVPPSDFGDNPYAPGIVGRNAFDLYGPSIDELPPETIPAPDFREVPSYYKEQRDIMRDPTRQEQGQMSQDLLARYAKRLGPEYESARKFAQERHPVAAQGARIEIDGETLPGKVKVGDNIITVPRGQGIPMAPAGFRVKGITHGTDKDGNPTQSVQLERYVKAEQPEFVATAKMIAEGDDEVKFIKELASTPGMAKEFNDVYSDATQSINLVEEIIDLVKSGREGGDRPNWLTLKAPWPLGDRELQAEITTRANLMKGKLRLAVIGPGAVSVYEQEMLKSVIADPTKFFSLTTTNLAKLETLKKIMDRSIKVKGAALGLFEYNPKREAGLRPMTGDGSDLASRTFGSVDEATAANLPAGTEVYIDDPENLGRRRHVIPETRRMGIPENPMYR